MAAVAQYVVKDLGGTIDIILRNRPDSTPVPTVTVTGPSGTVYVDAQTATVDAVNTTLGAAVARGDRTLTVASATSIVAGREYLIGAGTLAPKEQVKVRGISGTTITLTRPLIYAQASGATFAGTRLSYAVTGAQASAVFERGRVKWIWTESTVTRNTMRGISSGLYPHERLATAQDLGRTIPKLFYRMPLELDIDELLDLGFEDTLERIEGPVLVRTRTDTHGFIEATCYAAALRLIAAAGPEFTDDRDYLTERWNAKCTALAQIGAYDNDQDGNVEKHEGGTSMIRVG